MHKNLQAMIAVKSNNAIKKQVHGTLVMGCGSYTALEPITTIRKYSRFLL